MRIFALVVFAILFRRLCVFLFVRKQSITLMCASVTTSTSRHKEKDTKNEQKNTLKWNKLTNQIDRKKIDLSKFGETFLRVFFFNRRESKRKRIDWKFFHLLCGEMNRLRTMRITNRSQTNEKNINPFLSLSQDKWTQQSTTTKKLHIKNEKSSPFRLMSRETSDVDDNIFIIEIHS